MRGMDTLTRFATRYMIVVNVVLVLWVWLGRALVDALGWLVIVLPLTVGPLALVALTVTTVMTRRRYPRPEQGSGATSPGATVLSVPQTVAQLTSWAGLALLGLVVVDYTDAPDSDRSVLSALLGDPDGLLSASWDLSIFCAGVAVSGWIALFVLLLRTGPGETLARRASGS